MRVTHAPGQACGLAIRVPSWCQAPRLRINGEQATDARADRGYLVVDRVWRPGDVLAWAFDIAPRWRAVTAVPYFQWDNRDRQAMRVRLPSTPQGSR